jgi:uncharacterized repeat protein (TIGR03803 family)
MMKSNNCIVGPSRLARGFAAVCAALIVTAAAGSAQAAPKETVLYSFKGGSDGSNPAAGLIVDSSGNLYGTTFNGGGGSGCGSDFGCGTAFKLAPDGTETVLHAFTGGSDGGLPEAGLIADGSSNLYGTAYQGGASNLGVVFKLAPDGTETVLYSFKGGGDGGVPAGTLIADSSGNLYGTTSEGGGSGCFGNGCGTVFKLAPDGTETVLHAFTGGSDGAHPNVALIADGAGNLYGTTGGGGITLCYEGCGTVFKLAPDGTETVLHAFTGAATGIFP